MNEFWFKQSADSPVEGPMQGADVPALVAEGRFTADALISTDQQTWTAAAEVGHGLAAPVLEAPPPLPPLIPLPPMILGYSTGHAVLWGTRGLPRNLKWFVMCAWSALAAGATAQIMQYAVLFANYLAAKATPAATAAPSLGYVSAMVVGVLSITYGCLWLVLVIYWLVWLYKIHDEMRNYTGGRYPISPGKAVGFCFIPLFNMYWKVYVLYKLAQELEAFLGTGQVNPMRVLLYQVLSIVPGGFVNGLAPAFGSLAMVRVQAGLNELWERAAAATPPPRAQQAAEGLAAMTQAPLAGAV